LQAKLVLAWAELHQDDLLADLALVIGKRLSFFRDTRLPEAYTGEVAMLLARPTETAERSGIARGGAAHIIHPLL
jgi:hypothetical protein